MDSVNKRRLFINILETMELKHDSLFHILFFLNIDLLNLIFEQDGR